MSTRTLFTFITLLFVFTSVSAQEKTIELFNGKNLDNWEFVLADPGISSSKVFTVKEGIIHIVGEPFGYMQTKEEFENFHLYVEWRWPEVATNSGIFVFVQDEKKVWPKCIEMQLHAGDAGDLVLMAGADLKEYQQEAGKERPAFPIVKKKDSSSENPVGEWNHAEIICHSGNVRVFINGVFQNSGSESSVKKGRIALQSEGKAIEFRNVRLTKL